MSLQFIIPKPIAKNNARTLAKGFGLPLVRSAIVGTQKLNEAKDKPDAMSYFGTPMYDTLFIQRPTYQTFEYNDFTNEYVETPNILPYNQPSGQVTPDTNDSIIGLFLDGVIIDATVLKNIVKTEMIGMNGSVKEYINIGDIQIVIRGFVATKTANQYPYDLAAMVKSYASAPVPLIVTSQYLNEVLGVSEIVVESCQMAQQEGMRNVQYFQWNCVSNIDYSVKRTNSNV